MPRIIHEAKHIKALTFWRRIETIVPSREAFERSLTSGKRLKFYHGIDPTGPELHLGHAVSLFFLREMQQLGHEVTFLVGDFTAQIGDPTDKDAPRKPLDTKTIARNMARYRTQASLLMNFRGKNPARFQFNSRWLARMALRDFIRLAEKVTVQQLLEREMFARRLESGKPIHLSEFIYPLLQGYDSVALGVDAEVGGRDQLFNMLMGRRLLSELKRKEKFVIAMKLLENPKTKKKLMSKSVGDYVGFTFPPSKMFGAIMALPDEVIFDCFALCTSLETNEIEKLKRQNLHPRKAKALLAETIVSWVHGKQAAAKAAREFSRVFEKQEFPADAPRAYVRKGASFFPLAFLVKNKLAASNSEAKRLIESGAIELDGIPQRDWRKSWIFAKDTKLKIGKRKFLRVKVK
jgi:tyrosyl-tRNA synthetase